MNITFLVQWMTHAFWVVTVVDPQVVVPRGVALVTRYASLRAARDFGKSAAESPIYRLVV